MTGFLCRLTLKKLLENNIINEEDAEVYEYGLILLIGTLLKIIGFAAVGLITGYMKEIVVFLIFFSGLRIQAGGYHAKSVLNCFLGSLALIGIAIFFVKLIPEYYQPLFIIISLLISVILVFIFSPCENENRPLSENERILYRKRSILTLIVASAVILACLIIGGREVLYYASIASIGLFLESFTLLV